MIPPRWLERQTFSLGGFSPFPQAAGSGAGRARRARRAGRGAACAGRGAALLGCAPGRSPPPRLESANSAELPARRCRPGPRVSKRSRREGAGWRAPRLLRHLLSPAGDHGDAGEGGIPSPVPPNARPGTFEFRGWEGQAGKQKRFFFFPSLRGIVGLMEKAAEETHADDDGV